MLRVFLILLLMNTLSLSLLSIKRIKFKSIMLSTASSSLPSTSSTLPSTSTSTSLSLSPVSVSPKKISTVKEYVLSGPDASHRLISRARFLDTPLRNKDDFLLWSRETVRRKYLNDQEFSGRVLVRDIRKMNYLKLQEVENELKKAKIAFDANPNSVILYELDRLIHGAEQAITSMKKFIETNVSDNIRVTDKKLAIEIALPLKKEEHTQNSSTRDLKRKETPEFQVLIDAIKRVEDTYDEIGLNLAIRNATALSSKGGDGRNSRGKNFESRARLLLEELLVPAITDKYGYDKDDVFIVQNMKLGMASIKGTCSELDCMICVRSERPLTLADKPKGSFCKVLAIIEVKRNPDDIGSDHRHQQKHHQYHILHHHLYPYY